MTTRPCPISRCQESIPTFLLLCPDHWRLVSPVARRRVYGAWKALSRQATLEAIREHRDAKEAAVREVEQRLAPIIDRHRSGPEDPGWAFAR